MKWIYYMNQVDPSDTKSGLWWMLWQNVPSQLPGLLVTDGSELSLSLETAVCQSLSPREEASQ